MQDTAFSMRERTILLRTNENAQLQSAGGMGQLAATNWVQQEELRKTRGSQLVS